MSRYRPTLIGECEKAIAWANEITGEWLKMGMFKDISDADQSIEKIVKELSDHAYTKSHDRHLSIERCKEIGLKVSELEKNQELQDAVLSLHHACMLTFSANPVLKIIENHNGIAFIKQFKQSPPPAPPPMFINRGFEQEMGDLDSIIEAPAQKRKKSSKPEVPVLIYPKQISFPLLRSACMRLSSSLAGSSF